MKRATPVAFVGQAINSRRAPAVKVGGIAKILRVGAQRDFPKIPVAGVVVMRVGGVVDVRIVLKLPDDIAVAAPAFYVCDFAVFQMNLHAWPKAAGTVRAGDHSVGLGVWRTVDPFRVVFWVVVEVLAVLAGGRVWIHQQMAPPVDSAYPSLGHFFGDVPCHVGTFRIAA